MKRYETNLDLYVRRRADRQSAIGVRRKLPAGGFAYRYASASDHHCSDDRTGWNDGTLVGDAFLFAHRDGYRHTQSHPGAHTVAGP